MTATLHLRGTLGTDGSVGALPQFHENGRYVIELDPEDTVYYDGDGVKVIEREGDLEIRSTLYPWWRVLKVVWTP